jgi:predicted RNase H-like HicB family nuclease
MHNSRTPRGRAESRSPAPRRTCPSEPSKASSNKPAGNTVYYATVTSDGRVFGVHFEDFPGCITVGDTLEEAIANAYDVLALHAGGMVADGDAIPAPSALARVRAQSEADAEPGETRQYVPVVLKGAAVERSPALRVNITLQESLLAAIDAWAAEHGETRSNMLAQAARERMARK